MNDIAILVQEFIAGLLSDTPAGAKYSLSSLPGASASLVALALSRIYGNSDVFVVTSDDSECERVFSDIRAFDSAGGREPLVLVPPESRDKCDFDRDGMRLMFARALAKRSKDESGEGHIFIATASDLLNPLPDPDAVAANGLSFQTGVASPVGFGEIAARLSSLGYGRVSEVAGKGTFAVRGGLIDIWPPTSPLPVRIDFFGDDVDAIHYFEPATQRSQPTHLGGVWVPGCSLASLPQIEPVEQIPKGSVVLWLEYNEIEQTTRTAGDDLASAAAFDALASAMASSSPALELFTGEPAPRGVATLPLAPVPPPGLADIEGLAADPLLRADMRKRLLSELAARAASGEKSIICIDTAGGVEWLKNELPEHSGIEVRQAILSGGFCWPKLKLTLLAQPDVYSAHKTGGRRFVHPSIRFAGERVTRPEELRPGDLVVHLDHGIGRFKGTGHEIVEGRPTDFFVIEYAEGAELHVPLSQAHLLSRYVGVAGQKVALHSLGGRRWRTDCIKAQKAVVDYASSLLELQARRDALPGIAFNVQPPWLDAFESSFPFRETKDQLTCIEAVKADMARSRPMDRLICGDAGYGKTEVAMRAAFIAVMNGRQVAVLSPTTILAEQHFTTFRDRMGAFPVTIDVVDRLRSRAARTQALDAAANGALDILIGTHAILQPDVKFKNLGLVIIDEEQRFGVVHKERLKMLRATVDVLTLSATPIPRTLYMSMLGARDMSLLQSPPQERLEIDTKVERDSDDAIRAAIRRELARGGQVFFLHNRVMTINLIYDRLRSIVPEARIAIAHGQMKPAELASAMRSFESGEYNVLLSTSIVESGLDIPRANTMIIHRADRFGLAELYQLRGRVGRSSRRGYALLLIPEQGIIDGDARERIKAIQRHGGLSGGLGLALRDLEIRGAGNLLGAEQSGHIASIGFGLYCQLLKRTVARLKGEKPPVLVDVDLLFDFIDFADGAMDAATCGTQTFNKLACIPAAYIDDEPIRMGIYRRLSEASEVPEVRALAEELRERFGKMPQETVRMLRMAELRIIAAQKGYKRIEISDGVIRPYDIHGHPHPGPDGRFRRLKGTTADEKLTSVFKAISK